MYFSSNKLVVLLVLVIRQGRCENEPLPSNTEINLIKLNYEEILNLPNENNDNLISCVTDILKKYYRNEKVVTYVDMDFDCNNIIKAIHTMNILGVVNRNSSAKLPTPNEGYLLTVRSVSIFTNLFYSLTKEATWNPSIKFMIIFKLLEESELKDVFDTLLKFHVINVLIIHGTNDADLYTYNPFENYACGKYYSRIIPYGKCSSIKANIFPTKIVTGLRNCTFNITAANWPPYSINPSKRLDGMLSSGVEQYVMEIIARLEHFNINYTYTDDAEEFSTVTRDMSASGPMTILQNNKTDAMLGGLLLLPSRAEAFQFLYGHLDYTDDVRLMVKKASLKPMWENFYLEFEPTVWILLLLMLIVFSIILIIMLRVEDKNYVVLKLLDSLLLHGYNLRSRLSVKCVFIFWVWFAYLVNCFYQSNLMSLTTKPSTNIQISNPSELLKFGFKPCISSVMSNFIKTESIPLLNAYHPIEEHPGCEEFLKSIDIVSKSNYLYTSILYSVYKYNKLRYYGKWGNSLVYCFKRPVTKIINAIYLYKGFPLHRRMHMLTLRMKENGLVQKYMAHQYFMRNLKYRYKFHDFESRFVAPWYLYIFGCFTAFVVLVVECSSKREIVI